jgi:hypothetical protein
MTTRKSAGKRRLARRPQNDTRLIRSDLTDSSRRSDVMRNPDSTKKRSTPR